MKKQPLNEEFKRMRKLAGLIIEDISQTLIDKVKDIFPMAKYLKVGENGRIFIAIEQTYNNGEDFQSEIVIEPEDTGYVIEYTPDTESESEVDIAYLQNEREVMIYLEDIKKEINSENN